MSNTILAEPIRPRRVRRRLIAAVIILLPLAVHAVWDQIESTLLAREIAAIAAKGEPVNVVSRRAAVPDPELRRSAGLYAAAADLARWQSRGFAFENKDIEDHSTDALFAGNTLSTYLSESEPALQLLTAATPLRFTEFGDIAPSLYANQSPLETLNAMNCVSADALSARGEGDVAADALIRSVRLQRTITFPFYRNFSVRRLYGSLRTLLLHASPGAESLRRLQAAIEEWPDDDGLATAVQIGRAELLGDFWPHPVDRGSWALRAQPLRRSTPAAAAAFVAFRPMMTHAMRRELPPYEEVLAVARQPWPGKQDAAERLMQKYEPEMKRANRVGFTTGWLTLPPAMAMFGLAELPWAGVNLAIRRTAIVVLAVERYRRDHSGAPPDSLQALVPGYLRSIPDDPFSGRPPIYKVSADSYTLYSVDVNRKDDGGTLYGIGTGTKERWLSKETTRPGDLGIRVPLAPKQ